MPDTQMSPYRLYVDEVGNHSLSEDLSEQERYLTLFGVIVESREIRDIIQPDMQRIKREFFHADPDEPVIFHRREIARFQGPFSVLYGDRALRERFGNTMLDMYRQWPYRAVVVTIDKIEHVSRYKVWRYAPYHYCMEALLERYVLFLHYGGFMGDVMVEARGTAPDRRLADSFTRLYEHGTSNIPAERMQCCLTSRELKIRQKKANIEGLQLADLLAHAAHYEQLVTKGHIDAMESEYNREIARILTDSKYHRNVRNGQIVGYGKKFLP